MSFVLPGGEEAFSALIQLRFGSKPTFLNKATLAVEFHATTIKVIQERMTRFHHLVIFGLIVLLIACV